jgi:hypothetical protein
MDWQTIISMFAAVFLQSLKDKKKKAQIKTVALKIFNSIKTAYAGDEDFQ